jgi:hypothetical protein
MMLSPVNGPPDVVVFPDASVVDVTLLDDAIEVRRVSTAETRFDAALVIVAVSGAIVSVTGELTTFDTVRETPGSTLERVLVVDVTVCAAAVPAHSVTEASDAD